jgi:hypothetical protein
MGQSLDQIFFSPYGREFCNYFYFLMIFAFVFMIMAASQSIYLIFNNKIGIMDGIMNIIGPFIMYFTNRLTYSICIGAIH